MTQYFSSKLEKTLWFSIAIFFVPLSFYLRFYNLENPIIEPHPIRQALTGLTIHQFLEYGVNLLDYRSPMNGQIWNWVQEFPLYQWLCWGLIQKTGLSIEVASRLVTLSFFMAGWAVLILFIRDIFGKQAAIWGGLFYLIIPFNVIYSRTCLIDFTAEFFVMSYLYLAYRYLTSDSRYSIWLLVAATVLGALGATIKVFQWYAPTVVFFVYLALRFYRSYGPTRKKALICLVALLVQLAIEISWLKWTEHLRGLSAYEAHRQWLIGTLAERFHLWQWGVILRVFLRIVLHDWLVIPFFVALLFSYKHRGWVIGLTAIIFIPILLMFHVYIYHDYYFMNQIPFVMALVGVGFVQILNATPIVRNSTLIIMGILLGIRQTRIEATYGPIFYDYNQQLTDVYKIRNLTNRKDIVYMPYQDNNWVFPLYARRLIIIDTRKDVSNVSPSVLILEHSTKKRAENFEHFRDAPVIWAENHLDAFSFYRVRGVDKHQFDPKKHWAASENATGTVLAEVGGRGKDSQNHSQSVDICAIRHPDNFSVQIKTPEVKTSPKPVAGIARAIASSDPIDAPTTITIQSKKPGGKPIILPIRSYLNIPKLRSGEHCLVTLTN